MKLSAKMIAGVVGAILAIAVLVVILKMPHTVNELCDWCDV